MIFLITGGTAAAVNFASRIVLNYWMSYFAAVVVAYIIGMITAFMLARLFVFKDSQQRIHQSGLFFILVNLVAILQTVIISLTLKQVIFPWAKFTYYAPEIAHAVGIMVPVFTSYIGHKRWSFR